MNKSVTTPPSTKTESVSSAKKNKTPKMGPIHKTMLTPCRRLGLSAPRKKSSAKKVKTPQKSTPMTVIEQEHKTLQGKSQTVPSSARKCVEKEVKTTRLEKIQKPYKKNKPKPEKKRVVKIDRRGTQESSESKENSGTQESSESKENSETNVEIVENAEEKPVVVENVCLMASPKKVDICAAKTSPNRILISAPEPSLVDNSKAFVQRQATADSISTLNDNSQKSTMSSQASKRSRRSLLATKYHCSQDTLTESDDDDFQILANLKKLKHESTTSIQESLMETSTSCIVTLERMSQEDISQYEIKPCKRSTKRTLDSSDEDNDFVTSQKSVKSNKSNASSTSTPKATDSDTPCSGSDNYVMAQKIALLRFNIKNKQQKIAEMEQSEIYKKKHNLEELKALTKRWRTGCQEALNDLLPLIREKSGEDMDMGTLLNQMQIPYEFIGFNADENCFL